MIAYLITLPIDPAKMTEFEADFAEMARHVKEKEPDTLTYTIGRIDGEPGKYRLIEIYRSEQALVDHSASEAYLTFKPKLGAALIGAPDIEKVVLLA